VSEVDSPVRYREPGGTYLTTSILGGVIIAGFVVDLALGGGVAHVIGWAIAFVLVVGAESLTVYAARVMRTVVITDDEISVGEETLSRSDIREVEYGGDADERVLGRRYATGLPRGTQGVLLSLADGARVLLATRHPERVLDALGAEPVAPLSVRPAQPDDLVELAEIDDRSGSLFRVAGYELPQFDPSPDGPVVQSVYVIGEPPVGFVELAEVDGEAYVNEVAVLPSHMRRGYGTQLMAAAARWAGERGYRGVALTTFVDIPWNAPFFQCLGYVPVDDPGPGLAAIRAYEASVGLDDVGPRIAMRLDL
jgi:GNAT superfamily N-acetyltransferase